MTSAVKVLATYAVILTVCSTSARTVVTIFAVNVPGSTRAILQAGRSTRHETLKKATTQVLSVHAARSTYGLLVDNDSCACTKPHSLPF